MEEIITDYNMMIDTLRMTEQVLQNIHQGLTPQKDWSGARCAYAMGTYNRDIRDLLIALQKAKRLKHLDTIPQEE